MPPGPEHLADRSRFLIYVVKTKLSRGKNASTKDLGPFAAYRDSLLFWANHYYSLREETFDREQMFDELVRSTREKPTLQAWSEADTLTDAVDSVRAGQVRQR